MKWRKQSSENNRFGVYTHYFLASNLIRPRTDFPKTSASAYDVDQDCLIGRKRKNFRALEVSFQSGSKKGPDASQRIFV